MNPYYPPRSHNFHSGQRPDPMYQRIPAPHHSTHARHPPPNHSHQYYARPDLQIYKQNYQEQQPQAQSQYHPTATPSIPHPHYQPNVPQYYQNPTPVTSHGPHYMHAVPNPHYQTQPTPAPAHSLGYQTPTLTNPQQIPPSPVSWSTTSHDEHNTRPIAGSFNLPHVQNPPNHAVLTYADHPTDVGFVGASSPNTSSNQIGPYPPVSGSYAPSISQIPQSYNNQITCTSSSGQIKIQKSYSLSHNPRIHAEDVNNCLALIVAVTYEDNIYLQELYGSKNDAKYAYQIFTGGLKLSPKNIVVLVDSKELLKDKENYFPGCPTIDLPTCLNIRKYYKQLVSNRNWGDTLILAYSGHGHQTYEHVKGYEMGYEEDGLDENIVPCDYDPKCHRLIIDDYLFSEIKRIPKGVHFLCILDACHSGSMMDLPVTYLLDQIASPNDDVPCKYSKRFNFESCTDYGDVVCFSTCKDSQTMLDVNHRNERAGPLTTAFLDTLLEFHRANTPITYRKLYDGIRKRFAGSGRDELKKLWPQFSALKVVDIEKPIKI